MTVWRIYADGREFGQDYDRETAIRTAAQYRKHFPRVTYRIRKVLVH